MSRDICVRQRYWLTYLFLSITHTCQAHVCYGVLDRLDVDALLSHDGVLSEIPENIQWVWIFDSADFNMKHFLQIEVGIELAKLISSKLRKLLEISKTFANIIPLI